MAADSGVRRGGRLSRAPVPAPTRCVALSGGEHRLSEMLHMVMGLSMIAMIWPWGAAVPAVAWIVIFMMSTGWFAVRAVWTPGGRALPTFFATATGTMVWMGASTPGHASAVGHNGVDMAGMGHAPVGCAGWAGALLGGTWHSPDSGGLAAGCAPVDCPRRRRTRRGVRWTGRHCATA
ncbi:DUF5134 domain-containing protein [Micromonospora chersina]|uniref:DUF5134 domain-containing protein n=1 Tax=Micromonospora chersina TaxID=47854 RepID=UPI00340E5A97